MKVRSVVLQVIAVAGMVPFLYGFSVGGAAKSIGAAAAPDGKAEVDASRKLLQEFQGKYVTVMGMFDELNALMVDFAKAPTADELQGIGIDDFKGLLTECINAPQDGAANVWKGSLDFVDAAKQLKNRGAMRQAKATRAAIENTYKNIKACPGAAKDGAVKVVKAAPDQAKKFVVARMAVLDNVRKLALGMKDAATQLGKDVPGIAAKMVANIAKVEGYKRVPGADGGKLGQSLSAMQALQGETTEFAKLVTGDVTGMPSKLMATLNAMKSAVTNFGGPGKPLMDSQAVASTASTAPAGDAGATGGDVSGAAAPAAAAPRLVVKVGDAETLHAVVPVEQPGYSKQCQDGDVLGCYSAGRVFDNKKAYPEALPLFAKACEAGLAEACTRQGRLHLMGNRNPKQYEGLRGNPLKFFTTACDAGDPVGCYEAGMLIPDKIPMSAPHLLKGCNLYHGPSCAALGDLYLKNNLKGAAIGPYDRACYLGDKKACGALKKLVK